MTWLLDDDSGLSTIDQDDLNPGVVSFSTDMRVSTIWTHDVRNAEMGVDYYTEALRTG